jgi:hypothetical protein
MTAHHNAFRSTVSRSDLVIADLDFTPYLECDCRYPVPHAATYIANASCGCVYLLCESAMWQTVLWPQAQSVCEVCLERSVFIVHARPID